MRLGKHGRRFLIVFLTLLLVTLVMHIMGTEDNLALATPTTYTLSVRTWNQYAVGHWAEFRDGGINFTIDGKIYTSPMTLSLPEGVHTIEMPLKWIGCSWYSGCGQFTFIQWENYGDSGFSSDRIRTIDLTANMTINAVYWLKWWGLTVNSDPISGINFTIDGGDPRSTPWSSVLISEGYHTIAMSSNWTVDPDFYNFVHWENGSTEPTRTIFVTEDTTITATYVQPTPAEFVFSNLLIPEKVELGKEFDVSFLAKNIGDLEGSFDVSLKVNGIVKTVKTITLGGGKSADVIFALTATEVTTYTITVDGLEGTITVTPTPLDRNLLLIALTALISSVVAIIVILRYLNRRRPTGFSP